MEFIGMFLGFIGEVLAFVIPFLIFIGAIKALWDIITGKDNSPLPWYGWWQSMK